MLIVTNGKIVKGLEVYSMGDKIDGLSAKDEQKLISAGLAVRADDAAEDAADADEQIMPIAKEPSKAELQARCRELGLSDRGNKAQLQARIDEFENAVTEELEADDFEDEEPPDLTAEVPR